jgi:hypothetical protein
VKTAGEGSDEGSLELKLYNAWTASPPKQAGGEAAMTRATGNGSEIGAGLLAAGAMTATVGGLEVSVHLGWPAPLPSAWSLLAITVVACTRGIPAGFWAAGIGLGYAAYTVGFTLGPLPELEVWGQAGARVVSFGLVALALVVLVGSERPRAVACQERAPAPTKAGDLEALQRLVGRSANDLNNMLAVILASCELADRTRDPGRDESPLTAIVSAVDDCARVTDRLLAAARLTPTNLSSNKLVVG